MSYSKQMETLITDDASAHKSDNEALNQQLIEQIQRFQAGAPDAFDQRLGGLICSSLLPTIQRATYRYTGDHYAAEDANSLAIEKVYGAFKNGQFSPTEKDDVLGWSYTIARNESVSLLRRENRHRKHSALFYTTAEDYLNTLPAPDKTDAAAIHELEKNDLYQLLDPDSSPALTTDQQKAIFLHYTLGLTSKEMASTLDVSEITVRTRIHRGLKKLKASSEFQEQFADPHETVNY